MLTLGLLYSKNHFRVYANNNECPLCRFVSKTTIANRGWLVRGRVGGGGLIPVHCCLWSALGGRHVNYAVLSVLSMIVDCFGYPNSSVFLIDQHWALISFDSRGSFLRWNWIRIFFKNRIAHSVEKRKIKIIFSNKNVILSYLESEFQKCLYQGHSPAWKH